MTDPIDVLIDELHDPEDITDHPVTAGPGEDTDHIDQHGKIKAILAAINAKSYVSAGWIPFSKHGVVKDSNSAHAAANTAAINACIADAIAIGAAGVVDDVLPASVGNHIMVAGRSDFLGLTFHGMGVDLTVFECTALGAGIDFNAYGNVVKYGGGGDGFSVLGGAIGSPGIANRPMTVGLLNMPEFKQVHAWNALSGADGVCLLLAATQNGKFDTVWTGGGDVAVRFDAGASANIFLKPEMSAAAKNIVEFRHDLVSPAGQQAYTVYNELHAGIIEAPVSTTQHMVYSGAGALNLLSNVTISVNATAFGGTNPAGMAEIIRVEAAESTQASMELEQCKLNGGSVSGIVGVNSVLAGTFGAGRVSISGGSMGSMTQGGKGLIIIGHPTPWFFSSVTTKWDTTSGITTTMPHFERSAREFFKADGGVGDIVCVSQVTGESNVRYFDRADGTRVLGGGSGSTDCSLGRLGLEGSTGKVGAVTGYLAAASFAWNGPHFMMGSIHMWIDATAHLRIKNGTPTSDTDAGSVVIGP